MNTSRPKQGKVSGPGTFRGAWMALVQILAISAWSLGTAIAQEPSNSLIDIEVQALPGNEIQLRLVLSKPAPKPLTFTIDQPARIALDLADTGLALGSRRRDVNIGALDTVLVAEAGGRTRVVLNLDKLVPYRTRVQGNSVYVILSAGGGAAITQFAAAAAAESPSRTGSQSAAPQGGRSVESVDFRRTESGGGRVIIQLSDAGIPVDVRQEGGSIVVNFVGTSLPDSLMKRLDVLDFGTPVRTIDALRVGKDTRLVISALGPFEELAYQSDKVFSVEVHPVADEQDDRPATLYSQKREYTGERLTLNFQDIDSRAVLQLLADISGRNIVVSDTVQGNVTLRLQNVPWDQALDIVLATKGLDMRQNGNVIIVAPAQEIAAREKADLEA
ncbi:MAG: AMIN domain-containing protein, partial [Gammaproteobacteria bacterium]